MQSETLRGPSSASELYWLIDRHLSTKLVSTFVDRGVSRGQRGGSRTVVNLRFLDRSRYFSFKQLLIYPHKAWVDPVPDPLLLRISGSAGNRTRDLWVSSQELWLLDQRGGLFKRSILMFFTHLRLGHTSCLFPSGSPTINLYTFIFSPIHKKSEDVTCLRKTAGANASEDFQEGLMLK
jgi:hypothetical protein